MTLDSIDIRQLTRKSRQVIETGDLYLNGMCVYRVMVYNVDQDSVLLGTTNDLAFDEGFTPRKELRKKGFYLCPLSLREPAVQIFELDKELSESSLKVLSNYRKERSKEYEKFKFDFIFTDLNIAIHRAYNVPEEQAAKYAWMGGKEYRLPVPFHCISRSQVRKRINDANKKLVWKALREYKKWPLIYIPKLYDTYA